MEEKRNMLSEIQKNKFTARAKTEAKKLLQELNIIRLDEANIGDLQSALDVKVAGLVTMQECEDQKIDEDLLDIYDLLTDIVLDNEDNIDFLNKLFGLIQ